MGEKKRIGGGAASDEPEKEGNQENGGPAPLQAGSGVLPLEYQKIEISILGLSDSGETKNEVSRRKGRRMSLAAVLKDLTQVKGISEEKAKTSNNLTKEFHRF